MFSHDIKNDAPSMVRERALFPLLFDPEHLDPLDVGDPRRLALQVCKYYLAGHCAYGDGCRYDHVKPEWSQRAKNSSR